ncbi:MAG: hypothetical protein GY835_22155 [bacterium]|nr:hypothetical protein [bacterium]
MRKGEAWCSHLRLELTSGGLVAAQTGLPSGMVELSCQHAKQPYGTGRLSWGLPDFLWNECRGCPHHNPNGDTSWGEEVLREREEREARAAQLREEEEKKLAATRAVLRDSAERARRASRAEEQRIAELTEQLFSDNPENASESSKLLVRSAKVAGDLFGSSVVEVLLANAKKKEFCKLCFPIIIELTNSRPDLACLSAEVGSIAILEDLDLEAGSAILLATQGPLGKPPPEKTIRALALRRRYTRHPGEPYTPPAEKDDSSSTQILQSTLSSHRDTLLDVVKRKILHEASHVRIGGCELLLRLMQTEPSLVFEFLDPLARSLDLKADSAYGNAAAYVCCVLARAYAQFPEKIGAYLDEELHGTPDKDKLRLQVYRQLLFHVADLRQDGELDAVYQDRLLSPVFRWCLRIIGDEDCDLKVRFRATEEVVAFACERLTDLVVPYLDALLGTLALVVAQEPPIGPPRIVKPGEVEAPAELKQLEEFNRSSDWSLLNQSLQSCLGSLVRREPSALGDKVLSALEGVGGHEPEQLKAKLVRLAGDLAARDLALLDRALPLLWRAAMDYESDLVRIYGVEALGEAFRSRRENPPRNVGEALFLHLRDPVIGVHQGAIAAIGSRDWGLTSAQRSEALAMVDCWLQSYKSDLERLYYLEKMPLLNQL